MSVINIKTCDILEEVHRALLKRMQEMLKMVGMGVLPPEGTWVPATDMYETDRIIVILVDAAGARPESLEVTLHHDLIRIFGRREAWWNDERKRFHQIEIPHGTFERVLQLPYPVENEKAEAAYKNGLLSIMLPKALCKKSYQVEIT
ncbi:MAG: Hsp20/alpha crystallin family protein [Pseudomonadota bacterium]